MLEPNKQQKNWENFQSYTIILESASVTRQTARALLNSTT